MSNKEAVVIFSDEFEFVTNIGDQEISLFGSTVVNDKEASIKVEMGHFVIDGEVTSVEDTSHSIKVQALTDFHTKRHEDMYQSLGLTMTQEEHDYVRDLVAKDMRQLNLVSAELEGDRPT